MAIHVLQLSPTHLCIASSLKCDSHPQHLSALSCFVAAGFPLSRERAVHHALAFTVHGTTSKLLQRCCSSA